VLHRPVELATELGKGHMDYRSILAPAPAAGVEHIFVEQEPPHIHFTALEAAKANYEYLQSIGQATRNATLITKR